MGQAIDILGKKFGRWTVLRRAGSSKFRGALWFCRCSCGNEGIKPGGELRRGNTTSCGCRRREVMRARAFAPGVAAMRALYATYRSTARRRGLTFTIDRELFYKLTSQPCCYCGCQPASIRSTKTNPSIYLYNGLDRVDNAKGYERENLVPCCHQCNVAKHTQSLEQFLSWLDRLVSFRHKPTLHEIRGNRLTEQFRHIRKDASQFGALYN